MKCQEVIELVANASLLSPSAILGSGRNRRLTRARIEIAQRLSDQGFTLSEIGAALGSRSHSTIRYLLGRYVRKPKAHSAVLAMILGGLGTDE